MRLRVSAASWLPIALPVLALAGCPAWLEPPPACQGELEELGVDVDTGVAGRIQDNYPWGRSCGAGRIHHLPVDEAPTSYGDAFAVLEAGEGDVLLSTDAEGVWTAELSPGGWLLCPDDGEEPMCIFKFLAAGEVWLLDGAWTESGLYLSSPAEDAQRFEY